MAKHPAQAVVFQPQTYLGIQKGINQMAEAIRPTLGPRPRVVAVSHPLRHRTPELLDQGAVIAQRIVELPDRDQDVGAMLLRHVLLHVQEQVGDATATTAVLLQAIFNRGIQYITAGGNAMRLRHYLEEGMKRILAELDQTKVMPRGKVQLAHIAETICHDPPLAQLLGEMMDIVGEYGRLEIRSGQSRGLEREYVEGMYWDTGLLSREMISDPATLHTEMENPAVLITDLRLEDPGPLVAVLSGAKQSGFSSLLIVAQEISPRAMSLLLANSKSDTFRIAAVKTPGATPAERGEAMLDMAMLVGGQPYMLATGHTTLESFRQTDLGQARAAWATPQSFGFVGGKGDPRNLRQHIAGLRAAYQSIDEVEGRRKLQIRIGKLIGGSGILWVGGATPTEISTRKELAERTAEAMRAAIVRGVLPGGGVALLACRPALSQLLDQAPDPDERAAYRILIAALQEPIRTLVTNAGYEPSTVMAQVELAGAGRGLDVDSGQIVDMAQAGIWDVAAAQEAAIHAAVTGAAMALTTDVMVHHKKFDLLKPRGKW